MPGSTQPKTDVKLLDWEDYHDNLDIRARDRQYCTPSASFLQYKKKNSRINKQNSRKKQTKQYDNIRKLVKETPA